MGSTRKQLRRTLRVVCEFIFVCTFRVEHICQTLSDGVNRLHLFVYMQKSEEKNIRENN